MDEGHNTGFIEVAPRPQDWKSAEGTGVIGSPINATGDWRTYEPPGEWQRDMTTMFETDACVSFSANDTLETYGNYCIKHNLWPSDLVQWLQVKGYFNPDGTLNFSDRFTAKMSGTTMNGNTLPAVWESIRVNGLVPETAWPSDFSHLPTQGETQANWDKYYAPIPADVIALGKEFLSRFDTGNPNRAVQWEWIAYPGIAMTPDSFAQQLKTSPLQIATAVCSGWNTSTVINSCGAGAGHATMLSSVEPNVSYHILDHYRQFDKQFSLSYVLTYAVRGILIPVAPVIPTPSPIQFKFLKDMWFGQQNDDIIQLQIRLGVVPTSGYFGPLTKAAVLRYQAAHGIPTTGYCGPLTRASLNS
jgi:peptidoglycan hydrolase-like protein with peptidoglycan-binding domain